ncbi:MAG: CocE/NonD family hydrolase [Bacteroidales bacterium]|nr:CocE/NonD family hydrolase [Bacteroidales bacterium]
MRRAFFFTLAVILVISCGKGRDNCIYVDWNTHDIDSLWVDSHYSIREVMIPMRDGISLSSSIWEPRAEAFGSDGSDGFATSKEIIAGRPVLMFRGDNESAPGAVDYRDIRRYLKNFAARGYIFVNQSIRGTYTSGGEFVNIRPYNPLAHGKDADPKQIDESTDIYDTVEWLVHNTPNNGRVGIRGTSYTGYFATAAAIDPHPAMKTVSPQGPVTDWFMGDDYHHYGAFLLGDATNVRKMVEVTGFKPQGGPQTSKGLNDEDIYNLFKGWTISDWVDRKEIHGKGDEFLFGHKDFDDFWYYHNLLNFIDKDCPASLVINGSYDSEDLYGGLETFRQMRDRGGKDKAHYVFGNWGHVSWKSYDFEKIGQAWFGDGQSGFLMDRIEVDFYRYWLEGKGHKPPKVYCIPSEESRKDLMKGRNVDENWIAAETWPWKEPVMKKLYLAADGTVSFKAPAEGARTYISDPADPIPFYIEPVKENIFDNFTDYMASDQNFLDGRKDLLTYRGEVLTDTLTLAGPVRVRMRFFATGTDADFVVKLIDVRPDGYWQLVRFDVFTTRYRNSYTDPEPIEAGRTYDLEFPLNDVCHRFVPGHALMVQVQSSMYPFLAMNPQKYLENQYTATAKDYVPMDVTILSGPDASWLELPVIE